MQSIRDYFPGICVAVITGLAALFLSEHYGAPAMLFALLLGIAMSFLYEAPKCKKGIELGACEVLRIGVALLGLRIAFSDLAALGWHTGMVLVLGIVSTIFVGLILARLFGLQKRFGVLTGGAVGICGASAAMAISSVMPQSKRQEQDTLLTIIGVTSLSTIAMVLYPIVAGYFGLDSTQTSIFLGGTIHDVAQVVGAGYSVSEQTGDLATLTKLVRVAFLMPVVMAIMVVLHRNIGQGEGKAPGFPPFLIAFVVLMIINSVIDVPDVISSVANQVSRFALIVAIAAIGMKSNLSQLLTVGAKPIILMVLETIWIAIVILSCLLLV